jgi:hypothetical protein
MADGATLPQGLMLVNEWPALLRVTLEARFVSAQERKAAGFELLLNVCRRTFDCDPSVQFVTIAAADFALRHWVMVRQLERRANFQVTLETGFRRLFWIDNGTSSASGLDMQTPGTVARLAAHVRNLLWSFAALCASLTHDDLFCLQSRMGSCSEIAHDLFVTRCTFLRANKFRAGNAWRSENCSVGGAAGKQYYAQRYCSPSTPQQAFTPTVDPSS